MHEDVQSHRILADWVPGCHTMTFQLVQGVHVLLI